MTEECQQIILAFFGRIGTLRPERGLPGCIGQERMS